MTKLILSLFSRTPKRTILDHQQAQINLLDTYQQKALASLTIQK